MRLIDADLLKAKVPNTNVDIFENCRNCRTLMDWEVKELIDKMPTVDAVEVVRCRECKHYRKIDHGGICVLLAREEKMTDDWFCADGERTDG